MIELRGDQHEGGGQILRTALALSVHTGKPFHLTHIRAGRSRPGLQAQHLAAVRLAAQISRAEVRGEQKGSLDLVFSPQTVDGGSHTVSIGTAGSVGLLLQACFWPLAMASQPSLLELNGGTDVAWAPPIDYLEQITVPHYGHLAQLETLELRRGFFPKGGGRWKLRITPSPQRQPLMLDGPLQILEVGGRAVASHSLRERRVAERMAECAGALLGCSVDVAYTRSACPGGVLVLWAGSPECRVGASGLAEKGKSAETVAQEAVAQLRQRMANPNPVDEHLADQLVPLLALVSGRLLCQQITPHTLANIEVTNAFLGPKVKLNGLWLEGL